MSPRVVWRVALVLLLDALTLLALSELIDGFVLDGVVSALGAAIMIGLLNALVWPALSRLALPLTVLTLGLAGLLLNGLLVTVAIDLLPDAEIGGVRQGVVVTIVLTAVTGDVVSLLAIDEDDAWYRHVVRRQLRRREASVETDVPGRAVPGDRRPRPRRAPAGARATAARRTWPRWMRDGSHRLRRWETDWSSQTGACQAGLLHGSNDDMPAFRWWEKERGAAIVTNHPRDAEELERRHSDGRGLLHADGASRANILSGDAPHSMLTMSTALHRRRPLGRDYAAYFARPYAVSKTIVLVLADVVRERRAARAQVRDDVRPRIARSRSYALMRAWATVVQRDLQVAAVVGDILAGRPSIYTTFLAYDEVAHHSGIERPDSLAVLHDLDRQIARIARACADAPRPYRLVVLSDHGQSQGETFRDRYGETLEEVVRAACDAEQRRHRRRRRGRRPGLPQRRPDRDGARRHGAAAARSGCATRGQRSDGAVRARPGRAAPSRAPADAGDVPELSVMASGCLGLVSFPREPGRVSLERIERCIPTCCRPSAAIPASASSSSDPSRRAPWCSGRAASATWTATGSRARTRSRPSGPTPPITCGAPTASPTAPT